MRHLLPLSLLLNAALGNAAGFNGRLPARALSLTPSVAVNPLKLPMLPLTRLPSVSLPAASGGVELPGKPVPLPLIVPAQVTAPDFAPAALAPIEAGSAGEGVVHLRWDLLDGDDGLSPAAVPLKPGPKPLSPAGAMAELEHAGSAPSEAFDAGRLDRSLVLSRL